MAVQTLPPAAAAGRPIALASAALRIDSSAIRDLLHVVDRPDVISLAGGLPAAETFPADALSEAFADILAADPGALQYSTTEGFLPLREWAAERHGVEVERVLITHGSQQGLDIVARALIEPGAAVVLADPGYVGAIQALRLAGARLTPVPSDVDGLDVDALAIRLRHGERPAIVYVVANFNNPTGATLSLERRAALAGLADRYGFVVVEDDPYGELRWNGPSRASIASFSDRVVTLGTVSKIVCPGLRIGFVVAPRPLAQTLVLVKQAVDLHTSTLSQRAVHRVLTAPGFMTAQLDRLRPLYSDRCNALVHALRTELGDRFEFAAPDGGMFVWGQFVDSIDTQALLPRALEEGMAYVPGRAFAVDGDHRRALRLSFATATPEQLYEGVRRLASALR
ncbi:MAG: 2-aminoadipate transaminase [Acidimicrobiaceae bacterium]